MNPTTENNAQPTPSNNASKDDIQIAADATGTDRVADDDATEAEGLQNPIKHLEDGVWYAPQGAGTKVVAWMILIGFAACVLGLIVMLIASFTT